MNERVTMPIMAGVVEEVGRATELRTTIKAMLMEGFGVIGLSGDLLRAMADGMDSESVAGTLVLVTSMLCLYHSSSN